MIGETLQYRYSIENEVGRGGMGVVYRAHDLLLDRDVAVKVLSDSDLGAEGRARLLYEARAAAKLNHPNIVSVYDAGEADGLPFVVMELVEGESLHERPPRDLDEIVRVAQQLCLALEHAHGQGIVHRDLKPENVVILRSSHLQAPLPEGKGALRVKLMDFGLARSQSVSRLTQETTLVGTVYYLAPEQALGQAVDGRSDLYALGVMMYEWVTDRMPFTGTDSLAVISQHIHAPVVPPRSLRPDLPPALEGIILKLLAKRPEERFTAAHEVVRALAHLVEGGEPLETPGLPGTAGAEVLLEQLAAGRLVGRGAELARLRELWSRAREGHGYLSLISGEPGVGKTRLAGELMVAAQVGGALVLRGGCYEYEAATPYLPFVEALRAWVHGQDAETLRAYLGSSAPEIARLAPELEAKLGPIPANPPLSSSEERLRLYDNVARLFQRLAAGRGLLIFLDDLHWADQGTLHLLHYLLRHLRDAPVLLLAAYREVELDRTHPLAGALVEWNRERLATRLALGRLSRAESGALLAALFQQEEVPPEFVEAIYRETEGNPFFIEEVVKALVEQGQVYRQDGRWQRQAVEELAIPQSVKEAIGRRLNRLSPGCLEALHTAAALGKVFEYSELAAVASADEDQLLDALDEATASQLVQPGVGEAFSFTHDKIREVLYEELNPIRRRRLHQRVGEGLERLYVGQAAEARVQDLAHHFLQSGDLEKGLEYALRAGERAAGLYAHDEALSYYQQAAECAEGLNWPDQLADIHARMGDLYFSRGLFYPAVDAYQQALELASTGEVRAALKAKIGAAYAQIGDARGLEFLHAAQSELDPAAQTDELAYTLTNLGRYHHYRGQHSQAIAYLERAGELAEPLDHAPTLSYIYAYLAGAYQHLARFEPSMAWARQSISLGTRQGNLQAEALGYEFLAENSNLMGQWRDALDYALRDRQIGERIGSLDRVAWSDFARAFALHGRGELSDAGAVARDGLAQAEQIGESRLMVWFGGLLGVVETDLDLEEVALAHAELALKQADELGQVALQCVSYRALARVYIQRGDWERAVEVCRQGVDLYVPTENRLAALYIGEVMPEAYWGMGRLPEAEQAVSDYLRLAHESGTLHWEGVGLRVQGQIYSTQGRWDEAERAFDAAIARLDELGSRLELSRALYWRASLRQAGGLADLARADAARALALFEACGAPRDAEMARRL